MNRLFYSNKAIASLNSARLHKQIVLHLDSQLSAIQSDLFLFQIQNRRHENLSVLMKQSDKQSISIQRLTAINQIALEIYNAIVNGINAIKVSINNNNRTITSLDDDLLFNISSFINEYYKSDEIRQAIKNKCLFSMLSYELNQLQSYRMVNLFGVSSLKLEIGRAHV